MNICAAKNENARRLPDTFYATLGCGVFNYFLLASTTRSIPIPPKVIETTIPNPKIAIGTKSSIGIAYPLV
jgi:hypothetical protein